MGDFLLGEKPKKVQTGEMQGLVQELARGEGGPSAAELMMNRGMQQQVAAGRSAAASMPGVSPGMAMRQAGQREAGAMANVGQQMAILQAQEQQAAMQQAAQMEYEQAMYNASRQRQGGMLGPMLGTAGQMGAAWLGMPGGGGGMGGGGGWGTPTGGTY